MKLELLNEGKGLDWIHTKGCRHQFDVNEYSREESLFGNIFEVFMSPAHE